jgi:penicillin-binding protein 1A
MNSQANAPLKPIRTEDDHRAALAEIDALFGAEPGTPEADRLAVLCILVSDYERKVHPIAPPDPVDFLALSMQAQGRSQADLAQVLGSRSRASEVLARRRQLSADMIARLSEAWALPREPLSAAYRVTGGVKRAAMRSAAALGIVLALGAFSVGGVFWSYGRNLLDGSDLVRYTPPDIERYGPNGQLAEYRRFVPLSQIPQHVVKAFLAAEDQDYYAHSGYSPLAMLRAAFQNALEIGQGRKPHGAATITQQLAKNLLLPGQPPSIDRKIKEIILASRIEAGLDKDRILELYLNQIYFGGHAYGIAAAARQYFGKTPAELSVAEAAYLAALPKAPNHYRLDVPTNQERAKERRDWVLDRMADDGLITVSAARLARAEPLIRN